MNIKFTYDWLCEYLETDATPQEIQKYLSLCGPSVESVVKSGTDYIFDIEITSNRVDTACVFGIACEAAAILPNFGKKAILRKNPFEISEKFDGQDILNLKVNTNLCPRFTAIVLKNVTLAPSSFEVQKRLKASGIRAINNIVDISNYAMLTLGQPSHIFDFDKIAGSKMILRSSVRGEKITTLDGTTYTLTGGDIVIEDASGEIIDLCGIMGGQNSQVTQNTKDILLFVQTYDGTRIRKTSMTLGARSQASTYFEKNLDTEHVLPTIVYIVNLLKNESNFQIGSRLYDIYPNKYRPKKIILNINKVNNFMGVNLKKEKAALILKSLGFGIEAKKDQLDVLIPSARRADIFRQEDLIEEIARIYGYFNIPSVIQKTDFPAILPSQKKYFEYEAKIKKMLKYMGFNEVYNYSMISAVWMDLLKLNKDNTLKIKNSISEDLVYMRPSLTASILKNIRDNEGFAKELNFFEISNVYSAKKTDLGSEVKHLILATNTNFYDLKGIIEAIFKELNIEEVHYDKNHKCAYLSRAEGANIKIRNNSVGVIGQILPSIQKKSNIASVVFTAELNFEEILKYTTAVKKYIEPSLFAIIKLELTIDKRDKTYAQIISKVKNTSKFLKDLQFAGIYKNKISLKLFFGADNRNMTEKEALGQLEKIKKVLI